MIVVIALPFVSLVRELVLLVDAKGYTPQDAPILSVCVGHTIESVELCLAKDKCATSGSSPQGFDAAHRVGEWAVDMEGYPQQRGGGGGNQLNFYQKKL